MNELPEKLLSKLEEREQQNELRRLPSISGLVDFSSNDYLGFARDSKVFHKAEAVLREKGITQNGATGSRLLSGNHQLYEALEHILTKFHNAESAVVFNSGYDANLGFFGAVPQRGDLVFYDEYIHASIRDGIQLGNAKSYKFKHNNLNDLRQGLERAVLSLSKDNQNTVQGRGNVEIYIVTESVFSMDGDSPDLKAFADFSEQYNCHLVVDEAHAVGVFGSNGAGLVAQQGLEKNVFARIVTFGKAFGCHGAAILGSAGLKSYLVNFARSFIYTTGLPPHSVATISSVYELIAQSEGIQLRKQLQENIQYFNHQVSKLKLESHFIPSQSPIHCCVISGNNKVKAMAGELQEFGFDVRPILSPTVPKNQERLRFCIHSYNATEEITSVLSYLSKKIQH